MLKVKSLPNMKGCFDWFKKKKKKEILRKTKTAAFNVW